jgi:hypothetical protein
MSRDVQKYLVWFQRFFDSCVRILFFELCFREKLSTDDYSNLANIVDHNTENSIVSK